MADSITSDAHTRRERHGLFIESVLQNIEGLGIACIWVIGLIILAMAFGAALQLTIERAPADGVKGVVDWSWTSTFVFLRASATAAVVAIASAAAGGFLGMLFGIPKVLQQRGPIEAGGVNGVKSENPSQNQVTAPFLRTNTSFEEISDWLTKIIVGMGLIEFQNIILYVVKASIYSAAYAAGDSVTCNATDCPVTAHAAVAFFFALIIACFLTALVFVYLQARTRLATLFQKTEESLSSISLQARVEPASRPIATLVEGLAADGQNSRTSRPEPATPTDQLVAKVAPATLSSGRELAGWAASQARMGNLKTAETALVQATKAAPTDSELLLRLAETQAVMESPDFPKTALELIEQLPAEKAAQDLAFKGQLSALYLPPPAGYGIAIEISEALEATDYNNNALFHFRWACALGQKHSNEPAMREDSKRKAIRHLERTLELSKAGDSVRRLMKRMLSGSGDRDLQSFKGDQDFEKFKSG